MALINTDPSLPSNPAPLFTDVDSVRGDEMRANNNLIWANEQGLDTRTSRMEDLVATATSGGTLTLTATSKSKQLLTGTLAHTVVLPVTSTLYLGLPFLIINASTQSITINSSGGNLVKTLIAGESIALVCIAITGTTATSWSVVDVDALTLNGHADTYFALASYFTGEIANNADRLHGINYTSAQATDLFALVVSISSSNPDQSLIHFTIASSVTTNVPYISAWHCTAQVFNGAGYIILEVCDFVSAKKYYAVRNGGTWLTGNVATYWFQETNADGSVPNATNVYVNPSNILSSGSIVNDAYHTAQDTGWLSLQVAPVASATIIFKIYNGVNEVIVGQYYSTPSGISIFIPIKATQQFKATIVGSTLASSGWGIFGS
jgi:hypothetical protein